MQVNGIVRAGLILNMTHSHRNDLITGTGTHTKEQEERGFKGSFPGCQIVCIKTSSAYLVDNIICSVISRKSV